MPTYGKENFKESNVNYLNKDFSQLKLSLMNYAKSYFPDTYRDFNETSPGMMLLEMNAYVGDVLSFYIDQQYRELLLPLAEERRNIITMAKMFGYKVKPIIPSYTELTFKSNVAADTGNRSKINYTNAGIFNSGIEIPSTSDSDTIFTTLEPIDFRITGSNDTENIGTLNNDNLVSTYELSRTVRAVSATQKTIQFKVGIPEKFKTLTIPDTNVIDIISCVDSNGNNWYEVDFLAQDKVPIQTHYTEDNSRTSAYVDMAGNISSEAVPYSLTYITTPKRFTRETNQDNTTSLVFGNGVLNNGELITENFIDMEQIGIIIPGQTNDLNNSINPLLGNEYSTLGETPNNTTLTITYRVGGGINSNVPANDITTTPTITAQNGNTSATLTSVTNNKPARGGRDEENTNEIKEQAKAFFSTQNRCVTKEDYEARVLNIPAKFGNIAKVYVTRTSTDAPGGALSVLDDSLNDAKSRAQELRLNYLDAIILAVSSVENTANPDYQDFFEIIQFYVNGDSTGIRMANAYDNVYNAINSAQTSYNALGETINSILSTINIYVLGYNNRKQLYGNPNFTNELLPATLKTNIKNYLEDFKLMTDVVTLQEGYIINFGVIFDLVAEKYADKQKVKLDCIQKIKDYFRIEKMQFNQPINTSQLEFELMGVEGVRSIGHVTITQGDDYKSNVADAKLPNNTYSYIRNVEEDIFVDATGQGFDGTLGYGYWYPFEQALQEDGTILPANPGTPSVFELKNPNENIQGRVR